MRELKFRAYNDQSAHVFVLDPEDYSFYFDEQADNIIIEQFTGLKDKSGQEIYEGDIFKNWGGLVGVVGYHAGRYWTLDPKDNDLFVDDLEDCDSGEVIGNIHENPELLK